jgi:hypothetical protein
VLITQRLRPLGFNGDLSILKDYLHAVRAHTAAKRAYVRMEPRPGERFEIDWGHFGALLRGACGGLRPLWNSALPKNPCL